MATHARSASARFEIPQHQIATALIGTKLITYRVNRRSDQLAFLLGLVRMASAVGAISIDEHKQFLADLNALLDEEVSHG